MSSDCIFKKLKGAVNNASLPIFGAGRIKFRTTSASMNGLYIVFNKSVNISTDKSVTILNGSKVQEYSSGTSFTLGSGAHFVKPDTLDQDVVVTIYDKYSVTVIGTAAAYEATGIELFEDCVFLTALTQIWTNSGGVLDFDILKDASNNTILYAASLSKCHGNIGSLAGRSLSTLSVSCLNSDATGDIGDLTFASGLTSISVPKSKGIVGNLSDLYGFQLTSMSISNTGIGGVLESFLEQWYGMTKTSINLGLPNTVTFNGSAMPSDRWTGSASKSNGVLTLKDANNVILGTYDGATWTYA